VGGNRPLLPRCGDVRNAKCVHGQGR